MPSTSSANGEATTTPATDLVRFEQVDGADPGASEFLVGCAIPIEEATSTAIEAVVTDAVVKLRPLLARLLPDDEEGN